VKHKEENIKKLDEKAALLSLKKEVENENLQTNNDHADSNEFSAANISTSTSLALHSGTANNNVYGLAPAKENTEK